MIIESRVTIEAPAEIAWQVLTDLDCYPEWNPYTPRLVSTLKVGAPIDVHVHLKPGSKISVFHEQMLRFIPDKEFAFHSRYPSWLLDAERVHRIETIAPDRCTYHNFETYTGLGLFVVRIWLQRDIQAGFDTVGRSLKKRAEQMYASHI